MIMANPNPVNINQQQQQIHINNKKQISKNSKSIQFHIIEILNLLYYKSM